MLLRSESFHNTLHYTSRRNSLELSEHLTLPVQELTGLVSHFQELDQVKKRLSLLGNLEGLAERLITSTKNGLESTKICSTGSATELYPMRTAKYGTNTFTQEPPTPFWKLMIEALNDKMLIVLIIAGLINLITGVIENATSGFEEKTGWIDGFAVLLAVAIVVVVTAFNDHSKEKKFRLMDKQNNERDCFVLRNGKLEQCKNTNIVVGDVVYLKMGNEIPCDGVYISGADLKVNESQLTGESLEIEKDHKNPLLLSGTEVACGEGCILTICVGDNSHQGQMMKELQQKAEDTPLQERLT